MKRVLTVILFALTFLLLLSSVQAKGNENSNPTGTTNQPNFVPGELLVQFRSNSVDEDEIRVLGKIKGEVLERIRTHLMISEGRGNLVRSVFSQIYHSMWQSDC